MHRLAAATALVAVLGAGGSLLGGCGTDPEPTWNDADVTFASEMVSHHEQALEMADMTDGRPLDADVEALVDDVRASQSREVETMRGWLEAWDAPQPDDDPDAAMDMGGAMDAMMSQGQMDELAASSDADFQRRWLALMIAHHQGAVEMAGEEVAHGRNPDAVDLAREVEVAQGEEIATMKQLLSR